MAPKNNPNELASRLRNNCVLNPITALAIHHVEPDRALVLAGEDTFLRVYEVATSRQLAQLRIFHSQPIHGIHVSTSEDETRLLIWGAQSVTVLPHASLQILIQGGVPPQPKELKAADWIYDGILFPSNTADGVLVTAHNEIVPIFTSSDGQLLTFGPLTSPSRPILYSANLCWLSSEAVLVAGGTVFGEIIVWKYYLDPKRPSQWEVLYVFTGHEGSIFGVSISPEIELIPGSKVRLLASCSDDRTIRIWDITDRPLSAAIRANGEVSEDSYTLGDARETGFGGNSEATEEHKNDSSRCLAVAMGHVSRIWHVKFTGCTNHHIPQVCPIEVWSFGEDCTRQRWELTLDLERWQNTQNGSASDSESIGTLKHCSTSPCHIGKNIWSAAVSIGEYDQPLVVSGGADGKISISGDQQQAKAASQSVDIDDVFVPDYCDINLTLSVSDVLKSFKGAELDHITESHKNQAKKGAVEGFQRYAFLSEQSFLATTTSGRLLLGTASSGITWENIDISECTMADLKIYNIIKSPGRGLAVLGSASGKLYVFQQNHPHVFQELTQLPGKVSDIICLEDVEQRPNTWTIIATVLGLGHAIMLTFDSLSAAEPIRIISFNRIDFTSNFVITAAVFCNNTLILGSRIGVLAVMERSGDWFELVQSRKDCKTKDAVTCIVPLPGSSTSFLAGCRDGRYRIYTLTTTNSDDPPALHLQHEISPPLGMIEGAWFTKPTPAKPTIELVLYGFRGNNFVVWSETSRQELASVECGGAHRPFDAISPPSDSGQMKLVFTKASQLHFYSQRRPLLHALKEGGHGRELRAVASSGTHRYLATAAEDTTIRIWQYKDPSEKTPSNPNSNLNAFKCLAIIEKHSAGIQCLKWHGNSYLLSSAGNEELFIWRVTRLESDYESLAVVCEAVYTDRSADGDLRIMDFDVQSLDNNGEEEDMLISLALSNSTIKSYLYSKDKGFRLLATGRYTGACLTQIRHLGGGGGEIHLLTGSTDGYMGVWSVAVVGVEDKAEYDLSSVVKLHQSTVKSLDVIPVLAGIGTNGWLVATGGDDNAIGFMTLVWSRSPLAGDDSKEGVPSGKINVVNRCRVQGAHAAAITGLSFIREDRDGQPGAGSVILATVSNDQRVKLWRADRKDGDVVGVRVSLLDNQYSSVADPGDVEVIAPGKLMVGGVGMEVWDLF